MHQFSNSNKSITSNIMSTIKEGKICFGLPFTLGGMALCLAADSVHLKQFYRHYIMGRMLYFTFLSLSGGRNSFLL